MATNPEGTPAEGGAGDPGIVAPGPNPPEMWGSAIGDVTPSDILRALADGIEAGLRPDQDLPGALRAIASSLDRSQR